MNKQFQEQTQFFNDEDLNQYNNQEVEFNPNIDSFKNEEIYKRNGETIKVIPFICQYLSSMKCSEDSTQYEDHKVIEDGYHSKLCPSSNVVYLEDGRMLEIFYHINAIILYLNYFNSEDELKESLLQIFSNKLQREINEGLNRVELVNKFSEIIKQISEDRQFKQSSDMIKQQKVKFEQVNLFIDFQKELNNFNEQAPALLRNCDNPSNQNPS